MSSHSPWARGLYAITPGDTLDFTETLRRTAELLRAGISVLQYRDKHCPLPEQRQRAQALLALCQSAGTLFLINDDPELAKIVGAGGVHVGLDDVSVESARQMLGSDRIIGVSCYNDVNRAIHAARNGANYIALGAFFPTQTKTPQAFATLETLRAAKQNVTLPIVAIGGITPDNALSLIAGGADMVAVISSLYGDADPARQVARFNALFENSVES